MSKEWKITFKNINFFVVRMLSFTACTSGFQSFKVCGLPSWNFQRMCPLIRSKTLLCMLRLGGNGASRSWKILILLFFFFLKNWLILELLILQLFKVFGDRHEHKGEYIASLKYISSLCLHNLLKKLQSILVYVCLQNPQSWNPFCHKKLIFQKAKMMR